MNKTPRLMLVTSLLFTLFFSASCSGGNDSSATKLSDSETVSQGRLVSDDLQTGEGPEAVAGSAVAVHYTGWIYDETQAEYKGAQFDSSLTRNRPFEFVLGKGSVIKGWDQGVAGMQVGGKRRLIIPPELGYGSRGAGNSIPPNATLMFDIELLAVAAVEKIDHVIGEGATAEVGSRVSVDYTGWLYDENAVGNKGKRFDSSIDRGNKFEFVLGRKMVITGWDVGVQGMKVGGKRTLIIPASMAYGARGAGKSIPPNAKLVFDIELFDVQGGPTQ